MDDTKYPVTAYKADKILIMSSNAKWFFKYNFIIN